MKKNPYAKVKQNAILTASPQELTLLLYDGAIKFSNQAIAAIENKNMEEAHNKIIRVDDIVMEFMVTLDYSYEVSASMGALYEYIHRQLLEANIKKDVNILQEVIELLREFRDVWKEAMALAKNTSAEQQEEKAFDKESIA